MDKQGRLTKWEELVLGEHYRWKKGNFLGQPQKLLRIAQREGFIVLSVGSDPVTYFNWKKRFIPAYG